MVYADYDYYLNEYSGNAVAEADFTRLSRQASAYLDSLTYGKIRGPWVDDSRVKDTCCAIADILLDFTGTLTAWGTWQVIHWKR